MVQIMKDFPSCFGETGVQIADSSSSTSLSSTPSRSAAQNVVTCVYQYESLLLSGFITVTWIKQLMGQALSMSIENSKSVCLCKIDIKLWLFSRKGFKHVAVGSKKVEFYWDFSCAKFGPGPEPVEGFYVAVVLNQELCLLLGDLKSEAYKKVSFILSSAPCVPASTFVSKRENVFGKRLYVSKAQFCDKGELHDIRIEHDTNESYDQSLVIYIDNKMAMRVMHLKWKFRGNDTVSVDGLPVEVYWDVHSWLFGNVMDHAIFMFRTCVRGEKPSDQPFMPGWSGLRRFKESRLQVQGFSLVLCAWKND